MMTSNPNKLVPISDIFNGNKAPAETYIPRENGKFEAELKQGLLEKGLLCLLTGSSKTGKTSLYGKVLQEMDKTPIIIRCSASLKSEDFWNYPLESLDFSRLKSTETSNTTSSKLGGTLTMGWAWLAGLKGSLAAEVSEAKSDKQIKDLILAKPSPTHLVPLLQNTNAILVVEDFHYLKEDVQVEIFQQWKIFTDNEVSVILVGTTHHGVDLALANSDLIGRIKHIDLKRWSDVDLQAIARTGLDLLNFQNNSTISNLIAKESAGLPILTQQICQQLFTDKGIHLRDPSLPITFTATDTHKALHNVATSRYTHFAQWHEQLVHGPRKKARKYDTYAIILALFVQDPPKFSLTRSEIDERLKLAGLKPEAIPPTASINSTLASLESFQSARKFNLLEWSKRDRTVYILEPSFLFYLRWRDNRSTSTTTIFEFFINIIKSAYQANSSQISAQHYSLPNDTPQKK